MNTAPFITVIICTHNPVWPTFRRVLSALTRQTLPPEAWDLVIVDNASNPPIEQELRKLTQLQKITWSSHEEAETGLTNARCRGIRVARGDILVLLDDDTIPSDDFLECSLMFMSQNPHVGAAGGRIHGQFEERPKDWSIPALGNLAVRDFGERPMIAFAPNITGPWEPCGAGMVLRSDVASKYLALTKSSIRREFDRIGESLSSCGDTDLARCATDIGYYQGYMPLANITHVISKHRLSLKYLMLLEYSIKRDLIFLTGLRGSYKSVSRLGFILRALLVPIRSIASHPFIWLIRSAGQLGELVGRRRLSQIPPQDCVSLSVDEGPRELPKIS